MSIPLIQKPEKDDINTSIIAIKRNIERINMLLGLVDSGSDPDLSGLATKQELQDAITELSPVDEVTVDNMQSVTSNAVAKNFLYLKVRNASKNTGDRAYYKITDFFPDIDNTVILVAGHGYCSSGNFEVKASSTSGVDNEYSNLITMSGSTFTMQRNTTYSNINFDFFVIKKSMFYERT